MTDQFEVELRGALASRVESLPVAPVVERLGQIDYRPRSGWSMPLRLPLWPALSAAAAAVAAAITAVVLLASSSTPAAYAGWTPSPTKPTPSELAAATASCNWLHSRRGAHVLKGTPVLTDQRGRYTAAIYVVGKKLYDCLSDGSHSATQSGENDFLLGLYAQPGPDQLGMPDDSGGSLKGFLGGKTAESLPPLWRAMLNNPSLKKDPAWRARLAAAFHAELASGVERHAFGRAGSDVTAVSFMFADGTTVNATLEDGWYFAWWPSLNYPREVHVRTSSGVALTSPMMPTGGQGTGCRFGAKGCVWAGIRPQPRAGTSTSTSALTATGAATSSSDVSPTTTSATTTSRGSEANITATKAGVATSARR